jgi:hypothetical protein
MIAPANSVAALLTLLPLLVAANDRKHSSRADSSDRYSNMISGSEAVPA